MIKKIRNFTFRRKIFIGMLLAALIPMLVGYILMLQVFYYTYKKNFKEEAESIMSATEEVLDTAFSNIFEAMLQLSKDSTILNYCEEQTEEGTYNAFRQLFATNSLYGTYANFSLYDHEGNLKTSVVNNQYIKDKLPLDWGILYDATKYPGQCIVRNARVYYGGDKDEYLRVAVTITDSDSKILGYVVATVLKTNLDDILLGINKDKQGVLYAVDDFYEMVYYSSKTYDEAKFRIIRNTMMDLEPNSKTNLRSYTNYNNTYRYYETYIDCCNLHIYYQQPIASLFEMKNNIITIIVVFGLLSFLLCMLLSVSLSNYFYQPLKRIKNAITEIKKGNYKFKVDVESQDEFGELSKQFNSMSETIQENMQQSVLRERELSETQIQMMQAQLNPHFLFNTLDTLKWIGKANDLPEIVTLSAGLAQILRMSISEGQMIHLWEEISLVEAYVDIQKIRFSDIFELIVDLPKEFEYYLVPKLFLQPLVENAILHGFAECERGMVLIQGNITEENQMKIQVKDDGKGMSLEELNQMNLSSLDKIRDVSKEANIKKRSRRSIGLYNVNAMIKLRFGSEYGLHVQSTEGKGTTITILLPIIKEKS